MENVKLIPELIVSDARRAIDFYKSAFAAKDLSTHATPDGKKIMHAALELGSGGVIFLVDDFPERNGGKARTPTALGGSPITIHLNCGDVQATWKGAVGAGAKVILPLEKQFWGDVYGIVEDPFGHRWSMSAAHADKPSEQSDAYKSGAEKLYPTK
jgi:PhnB protein